MTSDFARVANSCIGIYRSLIENGRLTKGQVALAEKAIERTRNDLSIFEKRSALVKRIDKVFGHRVGKVVSSLIHGVGKAARPLYAKILSSKRAQGSVVAGRKKAIKRVALTFDVEPPKDINGLSFDGSRILDELKVRGMRDLFHTRGMGPATS